MAAVAFEMRRGRVQRGEQIEPGDAAPGPGCGLVIERDQHRRAVVSLRDPRGDDPDHAGMPAVRGEHVCAPRACLRDLSLGLPRRSLLERAALGVDQVELGGDLARSLRIVGQQQLECRIGPPQPPGGVDPRSEAEAERAGIERARVGPADRDQRPQAGPGGVRQRREPLAHEPPVLVDQRHQVGDRRERDQLDVLGGGRRPERLRELVGDRRAAQPVERIAADSGMDDRAVGQPAVGAGRMVVGDDHIDAGGARGGDLVDGGDRTVDGHDQSGPARGKTLHGVRRKPVAVLEPAREKPADVRRPATRSARNMIAAAHTPSTS